MRALFKALLTHDRAPILAHDEARVLTVDGGGDGRRQLTPEGYLLCREVPIARLGEMLYTAAELPPVKPDERGMIRVTRDADSLFSDETIASFNLKSVTNNHPPGHNLDPKSWKQYSTGVISNVRRGTTTETKDCLVADLLITDPESIRVAQSDDCEVSAGYVAEYLQDGPGRARQVNIIGNHLALVPRGRCGPRCAIGDSADSLIITEPPMPATTVKKPAAKQSSRAAFAARLKKFFHDSADGIEEALGMDVDGDGDGDEGKQGDIHIHVNGAGAAEPAALAAPGAPTGGDVAPPQTLEQRVAAMEGMMAQILEAVQKGSTPTPAAPAVPGDPKDAATNDDTPPADPNAPPAAKTEEDDEGKKPPVATGDSAALANSWQELIAEAALLQPTLKHAVTFDSAATRTVTIDSMCNVRRSTLLSLYATADGKALVNAAAGLPADASIDIGSYKCDAAAVLFSTAAKTRKLMNNAAVAHDANRIPKTLPNGAAAGRPAVRTPADINDLMDKHYKRGKYAAH